MILLPPMQNGIPKQIANYDVERRLGRGQMGTVYLARDRELGRHVAIKVIQAEVDSPEMRERFNREARSIAALNHPSIVTLYHSGQHADDEGGSLPYLVLEFIDGRSVLHVIGKREPVPLPRRLLWIEQLCEGLQYAHERGIIHRDIKPANLMIDHLDRLRILDFGIARIFGEARTQMSTLIGTPAYMAPEYVRGEGIDARADVFAAGAVAYELLSYQRAFSGDTHSTILHRILSEMPARFVEAGATDLDPELEQIVFRALSKDQNSRFQTAREFGEAIRVVRARVELSAETWAGTGTAVATGSGYVTSAPSWSGVGVPTSDSAPLPDPSAYALTEVVDARKTAGVQPVDQLLATGPGAHDDPAAGYAATVIAAPKEPPYTSAGITDAPKEPSYERRPAPTPPSNTWRYAAIAACVLIIPAALVVWVTYFEKPTIDTSAGVTTAHNDPDPPIPDPAHPDPVVPTPPIDDKTGRVDTPKVDTTKKDTPPNRVDKDPATVVKPVDNTAIVPRIKEPINVGPTKTAYELFNGSDGATLPGLIYRVLQRTNGSDSAVSVDPRETVFRTLRDQFRFAFRSNIDGYLYVAQKNDQGSWDVVFPDPDVNGGSNHVQKNQDYIAPSPHWFQLEPPSGTERVFVFLSKTPVGAFNDLNRPVTTQATLEPAAIEKLQSTISMRKLVIAKGDVPSAAAGTAGSGVYVVNTDAFANAVMVTFEMTHK